MHAINEFKNSSMARTSPRKAMPMVIVTISLMVGCMYLLVSAI